MKLTAAAVKSISKPGRYTDMNGLMLRVAPGGSKQWIWRGTVHGRRRDYGLGAVAFTSLAEARDIAFEYRRTARRGEDPGTLRPGADMPTFSAAVEAVIDMHRPGWKNRRSEENWRRPLTYASSLDRVPVDKITTADLARVLKPIWHTKAETARKLRTRLGMVMRWAIAEGHRTDDPTAALAAALPRHTAPPKHHSSVPHEKLGRVLAAVTEQEQWRPTADCLLFIAATACRSGEARQATWDEIDRDAEAWTIPAERTKTSRPLVVPLSKMALAALDEAEGYADGSGLVFPTLTGRVHTDSALAKPLREHGSAGTVHGMRASFRSWAAETGVNREVAEMALGHVTGSVERAYQRSDLLAARRQVMEAWSEHLSPR